MNQHINAVLETMNWPEDAFIPITNHENQKLMESVEELMKVKTVKTDHLKRLRERLNLLKTHHQDAESSIVHNSTLLDAHRQQCESEYHLMKLAENNKSTTKKLELDARKSLLNIAEQNAKIENDADILNSKIDNLGADMQWMKTALIEWAQAIQQNEQTNVLIEKYCKDDFKRVDKFEIRRQSLQKSNEQNRKRLKDLESEKQSLELVLDRTMNLYRQTFSERNQMIDTWRAAVRSLNIRDRTINESIERISEAQEQVKTKRVELTEQTEFLDQQLKNNSESEFAISQLNIRISKLRDQLNASSEAIQLAMNELIAMKRRVQHETNRLQQIRQHNQQMTIASAAQLKSNQKLKETVSELVEKVKKIQSGKNSSEGRLRYLDELFENEGKQVHEIETEMSRLSQMLYRSTQVLQEQQNEQKLLESEVFMLESANRAITSNFLHQEKELARQIEIQYDTYFNTLKLECRIAKMQGKVDEVDPALIEKRDCLRLISAATCNKREHVKKQLACAENMERRLQPLLLKSNSEQKELMEKLQNGQLYCENGSKTISINRESLHEHLVEHSLLKMRVHQMAGMVDKQMMKFYDLEKHKYQLQMAIDERMVDLKYQKDILTMKQKHLCVERDLLKSDINERSGKIISLKVRFELSKELLGKNEDGSIISAIQLKMETAQEKALLLDQGTALNEKVLQAETDIKVLENTLILLNYSNDKYKMKMGRVQNSDECNQKLKKLSDEYANALLRFKETKINFDTQSKKCKDLQKQHEEYGRELDDIVRNRFENNDVLIKVHKEIMDQNSKVERAKRESKLAKKAMMKHIDDRDYIRVLEKDFASKEMEHRNTTALHQLVDLIENTSIICLMATKLLYEKGLELPFRNSQQISCPILRTRSRTSVRSSGRNSECSYTLNSHDDGIISRLSERTFSSTSSKVSTENSIKSEKSRSTPKTDRTVNFQIEGQSIGSGRTPNIIKLKKDSVQS